MAAGRSEKYRQGWIAAVPIRRKIVGVSDTAKCPESGNRMDEWLGYLRERRADCAKMVVLMRQGRIGCGEELRVSRLIQKLETLIGRLDELIAEIEELLAR